MSRKQNLDSRAIDSEAANGRPMPLNPPEVAAPEVATPDPFDPERLKLSQDFAGNLSVKKLLTTVPVRKPDKTWWVRVNPREDCRIQTAVVELKEDREIYLVDPALRAHLSTESVFGVRAIFTAINRQGVLFLWPIVLPSADGKTLEWHRSALEAATIAQDRWIRVRANLALGAYEVMEATGELPEPAWPDLSFGEVLRIAFKDRFIQTLDHPVLRRLRGEV